MKFKRFCIVCEKQLLGAGAQGYKEEMEWQTPPNDGVHFTTCGNWGSTVYDTFGNAYLEGYICDACLKEKGAKGLLIEYVPDRSPKPPPSKVAVWNPERSLIDHPEATP